LRAEAEADWEQASRLGKRKVVAQRRLSRGFAPAGQRSDAIPKSERCSPNGKMRFGAGREEMQGQADIVGAVPVAARGRPQGMPLLRITLTSDTDHCLIAILPEPDDADRASIGEP